MSTATRNNTLRKNLKKVKQNSKKPTITTKKSFICKFCKCNFTLKRTLTSHMKICETQLKTDLKQKRAKTKLNAPKSKELDEIKKKELCNNNSNHVESKNLTKKDTKTEYICYSCGLVCKDMNTYEEHCKTHTIRVPKNVIKKYTDMYVIPPKECPICHREQKGARQAWLRHLDTHNSDICLYFCKICKKGFRRSDHKNNHERRHVVN